jgi:hypothetical protein
MMRHHKVSLKKSSLKFRDIALGLLQECSLRDFGLTKEILSHQNRRFCNKNAIEVF